MRIHLTDVLSGEGKCVRETAVFEMDAIDFRLGVFPVLKKEPVELTVTNAGDKVLELEGTGSVTVGIPCDRCLREVPVEIPFCIDRKLDMKLTEEERIHELDESSYLSGTDLDVDRLVYLELLVSWPLKTLCREDCRGICPQCGKDLNEGPCGCEEQPGDPRMAAVSDIFRKFKEV